jgi:hypothetical protein
MGIIQFQQFTEIRHIVVWRIIWYAWQNIDNIYRKWYIYHGGKYG